MVEMSDAVHSPGTSPRRTGSNVFQQSGVSIRPRIVSPGPGFVQETHRRVDMTRALQFFIRGCFRARHIYGHWRNCVAETLAVVVLFW